MKESWEICYDRGIKSLAVWSMKTEFSLKGTTFAEHQARVDSLQTLADTRASMVLALAAAREARRDLFAKLHNLNVRIPQTIEGAVTEDSDLHGKLALIYAVGNSTAQAAILRRARHVAGLWLDYNADLAGESPARPPLVMEYLVPGSVEEPELVTQANFVTVLTAAITAQTTDSAAQRDVTDAKSALRSTERRADRDNKRWYKAWTAKYLEGTPEGDAARSQVPTEQGTAAPTPIEIASATLEPVDTVFIEFVAGGGAHATKKELLYKLGSEPDYGHAAPITAATMRVGPFTGGQTVTFATRVGNSRKKNVRGTPLPVVIPA